MKGINFPDGTPTQVFTPTKTLAPFGLVASSKVLRFRGTLAVGELDLLGCRVVTITPSVNTLIRYFNSNITLTRTLVAGQSNIIGIAEDFDTVTITGTDASIEVEGM